MAWVHAWSLWGGRSGLIAKDRFVCARISSFALYLALHMLKGNEELQKWHFRSIPARKFSEILTLGFVPEAYTQLVLLPVNMAVIVRKLKALVQFIASIRSSVTMCSTLIMIPEIKLLLSQGSYVWWPEKQSTGSRTRSRKKPILCSRKRI